MERSGRIAVISGKSERSQDFERAAHVPTVEVEILGRKCGNATGDDTGTLWSLRESDGRTHVGVTAKKLDTLGVGGYCDWECNESENAQKHQNTHGRSPSESFGQFASSRL